MMYGMDDGMFDYVSAVWTMQSCLREKLIKKLTSKVRGKVMVNFVGGDTLKVTVVDGDIDVSWELPGVYQLIAANSNWDRFVNYIIADYKRNIERRYFKPLPITLTTNPFLDDPDFREFVKNNP